MTQIFSKRFQLASRGHIFDRKIRIKHVFFPLLTILKIGKRDTDLRPKILVCTYWCLKSVENDKTLLLSHPKSRSFCRPKFSNVNTYFSKQNLYLDNSVGIFFLLHQIALTPKDKPGSSPSNLYFTTDISQENSFEV